MTHPVPVFHIRPLPSGESACQVGDFGLDWPGLARALQATEAAPAALTRALASSPHPAFFWETSPFVPAGPTAPMRFVVLDAPALAEARADPRPFREHLAPFDGRPEALAFDSLGGDARLIAPSRAGPEPVYAHLAAFVRGAPAAQVRALWARVGEEVERWIALGRGPLWVSTSGLGVAWVHVRLDARPKYFQHRPYRSPAG